MDCGICTETISRSVTCAKCAGTSCVKCFQKYLLTCDLVVTCMHCRMNLSEEFINVNAGAHWIQNVYSEFRTNLMFEKEKARLPEDQIYAEHYMNAKAEIQKIDTLIKPIHDKKIKHGLLNSRHYYIQVVKNFGKISHSDGGRAVKKRSFIMRCIGENCKGYLGLDYKCGLCALSVCKDCHEVLEGGHICNPLSIESVVAIKKEARACPSCASLISKIDGCDQMWCTQCHVTFSWITGLRETGVTHNPHFYEWARKNGTLERVAGDIPNNICNNYPQHNDLTMTISRYCDDFDWSAYSIMTVEDASQLNSKEADFVIVCEYHRYINHIKHTIVDRIALVAEDNYDLRVRYLVNELSESQFKGLLMQRDLRFRKNLAKRFIYDMAYQASGDLFRNFVGGQDISEVRLELRRLYQYGNSCFDALCDRYASVSTSSFEKHERFKYY